MVAETISVKRQGPVADFPSASEEALQCLRGAPEKIEEEEDTVDVWRYHPMDLSCHLFFQTTLTLKA